MNNLEEKIVNISTLIENQFPSFVSETNRKFISFLSSYYESQETKYQPLDLVTNLLDYYNIGYFTSGQLIESTKLISNINSNINTIGVSSTDGFPETNGYIQIGSEIVFYRTKTPTQFVDCVRGTSAFLVETIPLSQVVYTNSVSTNHNENDTVLNLAYTFTEEFLRRIKSEIAPNIPENLVSELNFSSFLKNVKSFYTAKGSLNSHKILFKILFNDRKIKIRLRNRGTGAKINLINLSGSIGAASIAAGGTGYDNRTSGSLLVNPPIIDVIGSGSGTKVNNIFPLTATVRVTSINSTGSITGIQIDNQGQGYIGPITARVRERSFKQDQIIRNVSGTGYGRIDTWDFGSNEVTLYDVVGYFRVEDELVGDGGESPKAFISKAYPVTDINKKGNPSIEVISKEPSVENPKDFTIKPSSSTYVARKVIHCELISNSLYKVVNGVTINPSIISLVQEKDLQYGLKGVSIESSEFTSVGNNIYEFDINSNRDYKDLYQIPTTKLIVSKSSITLSTNEFTLTADDLYGFPLVNGIVYIGNKILNYTTRSCNQLFGCTYSGAGSITLNAGDEIYAYGRVENQKTYNYFITGYVDGDFTDSSAPVFKLLGVSSEPVVDDGGALYTSTNYEIKNTPEVIETLPQYTSWNINSSATITNSALNAYQVTPSVQSVYDYENYAYVTSSGVPPYLNTITGRNTCKNQKLLKRVKTSVTNSKGSNSVTRKGVGITVDGIEIQSPKGSTINYGTLTSIIIGNVGNYKVPISSDNLSFNYLKYPVFLIDKVTSPLTNTSSQTLFYISSSISEFDINNIDSSYLTGYLSKPIIQVINNNPYRTASFIQSNLNYTNNSIEITSTTFESGEKVTYTSQVSKIGGLIAGSIYYIGVSGNNTYKLYYTKEDALNLSELSVSFTDSYNTEISKIPFVGVLTTDNSNPLEFENAELDISFNESTNTIDNILIRNSGKGYVVAPSIVISGGGKVSQTLPFKSTTGDIFTFRGGLVSKLNIGTLKESEIDVTGLISTIFQSTPNITVSAGEGASVSSYTSNGIISSIELNSGGKYYYTEPTVQISGIGVNAYIKSIINVSTGRVTGFSIINPGNGYTITPVVQIIPSGAGGLVSAQIKSWTFNLSDSSIINIDNYGGYTFDETDIANMRLTLKNLPESLNDRQYLVVKTTSNFNTQYEVSASTHSKIIGWAYDGNPIYGKYGYSNPLDKNSSITQLTSSWQLKSSRNDGPPTSTYSLGSFIEDYQLTTSLLDKYNGRFCVTPEFPNGTYAYFATDAFPYFIGLEYYSTVDEFNVCGTRRNDRVPGSFRRINNPNNSYYPKEYKNTTKSIFTAKQLGGGKINSVIIENSGDDYKTLEKLIVDNSNTSGIGFGAFVSKISGKSISSYQFIEDMVRINTSSNHGMSESDYVYINYTRNTTYTDVTLEPIINLNYFNNAKITSTSASSAKFSYDKNNVNPYYSDAIIFGTNQLKLNTNNLPDVLYLHLNSQTYQLVVNKYKLLGQYIIQSVTDTSFDILCPFGFTTELLTSMYYDTKSPTALGKIKEISISNFGTNYKKLPEVLGVDSKYGYGALIQLNSNDIGKISKFNCVSIGDKLTSNKTINYELEIPYTAKITNNFKISSIEVLTGGSGYVASDIVKVDGVVNTNYKFEIVATTGSITEIKVLDGGFNLNRIPSITVESSTGTSATFSAKLKRKEIYRNDIITFNGISGSNSAKIVHFDSASSTVEFLLVDGICNEGNSIYSKDLKKYGNIVSIRKAKSHVKSQPYAVFESKFLNNNGFLNDYTQRIHDSKYYQEWSYLISSSRNTSEWKSEVVKNTHPSGFKVFGKNVIEKTSSVFKNKEDIFNSSVIFTTNLSNKIGLNLKLSKCNKQTIQVANASSFSINDYVYGNISETKGIITNIQETYIEISPYNENIFEIGESLFKVSSDFVSGDISETLKSLSFYSGILQKPKVSYYVSLDNYIQLYQLYSSDEVTKYKLTSAFELLDSKTLFSGTSSFTLTKSNIAYIPNNNNKETLLISINGIVQDSDSFTLSGNTVTLQETVSFDSPVFVITHQNLRKLTFTGSGTNYTLNYTPSSYCQLLIFNKGIGQSHLTPLNDYTISGNAITLSESTDLSDLFGWQINEDVICSKILTSGSQITDYNPCTLKKITEKIESNGIKTSNSFFEIAKKVVDGTVYATSDTIYGYDTRFVYTNPEYSNSYVEVLNAITYVSGTSTYNLTRFDSILYTPVNGKKSLVVYVDNLVLDPADYSVSGSTITFTNTYTAGKNFTLIDFVSNYLANNTNNKCADLDRLNVIQNGIKSTFNLSDRGVPQYINNVGDIFVIKNNILKQPNSTTQSLTDNKITLTPAPVESDNIKLIYFNRQLLPNKTKNVILDTFRYYNSITTTYPLTIDGLVFTPVSVYNLLVCRNGLFQRPGVDFTLSESNIVFSEAPSNLDDITIIYSYNNLNTNSFIANFTASSITTTVSLGMTPPNVDDLYVLRNGIFQNPTQDFTVTGSVLTFTDSVAVGETIFIMYTHGSDEIAISSVSGSTVNLATSISSGEADGLVLYINGTPKFNIKDFTVAGSVVTLLGGITVDSGTTPFAIKYVSSKIIDDISDSPDGIRTRFKLLYNAVNLIASDIGSDADILISKNGIIQYPGVQYTLTSNRRFVDFVTAPQSTDEIFMIRMSGNQLISMTSNGSSTTVYNLGSAVTTQQENVVVFSNNQWIFAELNGFTWTTTSRVTLSSAQTTGNIFAIKFNGAFRLLDQTHTPFNSSNTKFNLFLNEQNFIPSGNIATDYIPSESSLLVMKNGKILDGGVDYTLQGDIKSQIQFVTAPTSTDKISIKVVGAFLKLQSITSGFGGKIYNLKSSSTSDYYPNAAIGRPREHENQIIILKDGNIQSPLYDYYIDNNKIVFLNNVSASKLVILDFMGTTEDMSVFNVSKQVSVGDAFKVSGETTNRVVTEILSPTVLKTESYSGTSASGFVATSSISNGKLQNISITNGGTGYTTPVILRTKGTGTGAKALASINATAGNSIVSPITIQYPGYNLYTTQEIIPTAYSYVYRKKLLSSSTVRKATTLTSNINSSIETIPVGNTTSFDKNTPVITISSNTGSSATFRVFVNKGRIRKVEVLNGGLGYDDRDILLTLSGGGGSGCVLEPVLDALGTITSVIVNNGGIGYDSFRVIIDNEIIEYTDITTTQLLGCTRGVSPTSHTSSTLVYSDNFV
jgi:hypothetical protein